MRLKEMTKGLPYVVTKGGDTLAKGDHIRMLPNGDILCIEASGWLEHKNAMRLRNEVEIDQTSLKRQLDRLAKATKALETQMNKGDTK